MKEARAEAKGRFLQRVAIAGLVLGAISGTAWSVRASNFGSGGLVGNDYTPPIGVHGVWLTDNTDFRVAFLGSTTLTPTCAGCTQTYAAGVQAALGTGTISGLSSMGTSPSDLDPVVDLNPAGGCPDASYDACVLPANYTLNGVNTGLCGWNQCTGTTSGSGTSVRCSIEIVRMDTANSGSCGTARSLACHELGHSVGLRHTNGIAGVAQDDCMMSGQGNSRAPGYNSHNIGHLQTSY